MPLPSLSRQQRTYLAIVFSLVSILAFLGRSIYLLVTDILPRTIQVETMRMATLESTTMLTCALLMLPMLLLNLRALRGDESRPLRIPPLRLDYAVAIGALWVVTLCLGSAVALIPEYGWAGTIPLQPFGILLPLAILVWTSAGGLLTVSKRRFWSVLGFGIAGSSGLAMVGEYLVLGIGRGIGELAWGQQPFWRELVDRLGQQLEAAATPEETFTLLEPYLSNLWVFLALMLFAACLVPLIEEAAKASLLLYLGPDLRSVGEGFALGALCGAGFSLLEGMLAISAASFLWGFGVVGRVSSSLMHVTVSALLGGAIAQAFLRQRRRQWIGTYLLSSGIHGLWNGALLSGLYLVLRMTTIQPESNDLSMLVKGAVYGLLILLITGFVFALFTAGAVALPLINARLRRQAQIEGTAVHIDQTAAPANTSPQEG